MAPSVIEGRAEPGLCLIGGGVGVAPLLSILRARRHGRRPAAGPADLRQPACQGQILAGRTNFRTLGAEVVHVLQEPPPGWAGETGMITRDHRAAALCAAPRGRLAVRPVRPAADDARGPRRPRRRSACRPRRILEERFVYRLSGPRGPRGA